MATIHEYGGEKYRFGWCIDHSDLYRCYGDLNTRATFLCREMLQHWLDKNGIEGDVGSLERPMYLDTVFWVRVAPEDYMFLKLQDDFPRLV